MAKNARTMLNSPVQSTGIPNVAYVRQELLDVMPIYTLIADSIAGSHAIKAGGDKYLPRPNAADLSNENKIRYNQYLSRAVYYNVTRRTIFALAGQIFLREPQIDLPTGLQPVVQDASGENVPLAQHAEIMCRNIFAYGRGGLFGDYPTTTGELTQGDMARDDVRPVITSYTSANIINWRKALRGRKQVYTLVVLREPHVVYDNGFAAEATYQYKVLRLVPADMAGTILAASYADPAQMDPRVANALGRAKASASDVYFIEIWRETELRRNERVFVPVEQYFPTDSDGAFLHEIPFQFVGAEKNDDTIDHPPMTDLAEMNVAHYRNSADYEETSFLTGQPTPFVSGITQEWADNVLKGTIQLGSRGVIPLPSGGTAGLLQATANSVPFEAMQHKERQMVALGAKLVEQRQVQRTATEAEMEGAADTSALATVAKNVSNAYLAILRMVCAFTGDDPTAIKFALNTEFDLTRMDANERAQTILEWQSGALTTTEMRNNLRRGGIATLDDKAYAAEAATDEATRLARKAKQAETEAKAKGADPNNPPGRNPAKPNEAVKGN